MLNRRNNAAHLFNFLPVVFEKAPMTFFLQSKLVKNSSHLLGQDLNILLSLRFFTNAKPVSLIDLVCYDYVKLDLYEAAFKEGVWSTYILYSNKLHLYLNFTIVNPELPSASAIFKNLAWLEREQREFFGLVYRGQTDTRNLLLDYAFKRHILLKSEDIATTDDKSSDHSYFDAIEMADFTSLL